MSFYDEIQALMVEAEVKQKEGWNAAVDAIKQRIREAAKKLERSVDVVGVFDSTSDTFLREHPDLARFRFEAIEDRGDTWIRIRW